MGIPKRIYIHHSGDSSIQPQFWKINSYHKDKWNFKSKLGWYGGYNRLIEKSGITSIYRFDGEETAAQKGDNVEALSVCFAGNLDVQDPTDLQLIGLQKLLDHWMTKYRISSENVLPHRSRSNTSCPGKNLTDEHIKAFYKPTVTYIQSMIYKARLMIAKLIATFKSRKK